MEWPVGVHEFDAQRVSLTIPGISCILCFFTDSGMGMPLKSGLLVVTSRNGKNRAPKAIRMDARG